MGCEKPVHIFAVGQGFIQRPNTLKHLAPTQDRTEVVGEEGLTPLNPFPLFQVKLAQLALDDIQIRPVTQKLDLQLQSPLRPQVIRIYEGQVFPRSDFDSVVASRGGAEVFLV